MTTERRLYADRSERGKLRFTGPQSAWFLHQILTQSFEDAGPGEARDAAMLTTHGRMLGYLEVLVTSEGQLAHFEPELRATLPEDVGRYVFATQVEIEDVTDSYGLVLVTGDDSSEVATRVAPDVLVHRTLQLGVPAVYLWVERAAVPEIFSALEEEGLEGAAEEELEAIRIEHGMARWGRDMNAKTLPPEANLDEVAVHYDKGCYLGQETMAKIKFRGHVNRKLRRLRVEGDAPPGAEVTVDGTKAGTVTSTAGRHSLALLRYTIEPGTAVSIGEVNAVVVE